MRNGRPGIGPTKAVFCRLNHPLTIGQGVEPQWIQRLLANPSLPKPFVAGAKPLKRHAIVAHDASIKEFGGRDPPGVVLADPPARARLQESAALREGRVAGMVIPCKAVDERRHGGRW